MEIKNEGRKIKINGYKHTKLDQKRDARRRAADLRNGAYEGLTVKERIKVVNDRIKAKGGESKRELARLQKLLAAEKAPAVKVAPLTEEQKNAKVIQRSQDAVAAAPKAKVKRVKKTTKE